MAIRREFKRFYGAEWRAYRRALIEAHGARCSVCGREVLKYLNLAHRLHDPRSSAVALMCPADHARHDARHAYSVRRRNLAKQHGQLWLWDEVAYAPFPAWLVPRRALNLQGGLFG